MEKQFDLQRVFALFSLLIITAISAASGYVLFSFLSQQLLERDMDVSMEFIQSVASINDPDPYFRGSDQVGDRHQLEEFFRHITQIPDVIRAAVYDRNQTIIWSDETDLIGQRFQDNDELKQALSGHPVFKLEQGDDYSKTERSFLPIGTEEFVESYLPIWDAEHAHVIGVVELYRIPLALYDALAQGRWLVVGVSVGGGMVLYLMLFWIVRRAALTIARQDHALRAQVQQLSNLLDQNRKLHRRIRFANSRVVELNELFLRRVGAELHDGPAQALGFALLRLDAIRDLSISENVQAPKSAQIGQEFDTIRGALKDALQEIRSLSAGLAVPELVDLSLSQAIQRVTRLHQQRTQSTVDLQLADLPEHTPLPLKICVYRLVQEGLNNAYRHGQARCQTVTADQEDDMIRITVSDAGTGFAPAQVLRNQDEHLGLLGLRERIESLGGQFQIDSARGTGTRLSAWLPLGKQELAYG